jgi:hypothetical protein
MNGMSAWVCLGSLVLFVGHESSDFVSVVVLCFVVDERFSITALITC